MPVALFCEQIVRSFILYSGLMYREEKTDSTYIFAFGKQIHRVFPSLTERDHFLILVFAGIRCIKTSALFALFHLGELHAALREAATGVE